MSYNSFGHMFRVTTFGESHGPAIGCVVDAWRKRTFKPISIAADRGNPSSSRNARSPTR